MCGSKRIQWRDLSVMTKPLPNRWGSPVSLPAPGIWEKHIHRLWECAAHSHPSQPCQGRAAGTGHTCPVSKPRGTQLRLAEEALAPERPSALCLPLAHGEPLEPPVPTATPPAYPCCQQGRTSLGSWDTQTWAHHQGLGPCASPATVTATASCPPLMCQHNLLPLLGQPQE